MKTIVHVPTINANDDAVTIVRWHAPDGTRIEAGHPLVDIETTKAVVTIDADPGGWVRHVGRVGDELAVGAELAWFFSEEAELAAVPAIAPASGPVPATSAQPAEGAPGPAYEGTRLSPAAVKLAAELGLDRAALERAGQGLLTAKELRARFAPGGGGSSAGRREKPSPAKRAEIHALCEGLGAHLRTSLTVYFDSAGVRMRLAETGGGILAVILCEVVRLLVANPRFNAWFADGEIVFYDAVCLGVALDLGQGLKVVTLPGTACTEPADVERWLAERTLDYEENRLGLDALQSSTFTVTDLSGFDVMQFEPLLNGRQAAILGLGGDVTLPGHPMSLTLAFDHRVLSGREVALFLRTLRDRILTHAPVLAAAPADAPAALGLCCDRCQIDLAGYYAKFGPAAVMHQYIRPDGTTGLICHACLASL